MRFTCALFVALWIPLPVLAENASVPSHETSLPSETKSFLSRHCIDCHEGETAEAGLDLTTLSVDMTDPHVFESWVTVFDRVHDGEMPPAEMPRPQARELERFTRTLGQTLRTRAVTDRNRNGRVQAKKLTALQLERSLHDLLGIDVPLAPLLPEEARTKGFNTVAEGQSMSHFDLENHLTVVDAALDEAFRRALTREDTWTRKMSAKDLARRNPRSRNRDPELYKEMAVVWSNRLVFYGRITSTTAREDGWYRFTFDVSTLKQPEFGVWCTVRTGECRSSAPLMTEWATFQATETPQTVSVTAWLPKGHMFEVKPHDHRLKSGRTKGGQVGAGEHQPQNVPGIGLHHAVLKRIHHGPDDAGVRDLLLGDLDVKFDRKGRSARVVSKNPKSDLTRLMNRFANRAFRRPVSEEVVAPYVELALERLRETESFTAALRDGYRSLLCSPRFVYLHEEPGDLDSHALASRLSYFLWNSMPDAELRRLADADRLRDPQVLREQVDRMLQGKRGRQFVNDFARQWLDLSEIDFTQPDRRMYGKFDLVVQQSMLDETQSFLETMLRENLSVSHVIDSDFMLLNERLAAHYGIEGVTGQELRRVSIGQDDPRGGLLTQGAILKVTANGTNTSPVIRGVWVSERLLGEHIPAPPENVPAVEPDIRGATTIREQLAKHRSDTSCAACHVKIDPPGFALETFDPVGGWRTNYLKREGRRLKRGPAIDASYELPGGESFRDVVGFQKLMTDADGKRQLAKNVAAQLITYGTGAPIAFGDRDDLATLVERTRKDDYGFRSLIHAVVQSDLFTRK